jgi:hypothetical protein
MMSGHYPGFQGSYRLTVFVFPELLVCHCELCCGETSYHSAYQLHERGQNVTSTEDVQFDCGPGAKSGAFHFSY